MRSVMACIALVLGSTPVSAAFISFAEGPLGPLGTLIVGHGPVTIQGGPTGELYRWNQTEDCGGLCGFHIDAGVGMWREGEFRDAAGPELNFPEYLLVTVAPGYRLTAAMFTSVNTLARGQLFGVQAVYEIGTGFADAVGAQTILFRAPEMAFTVVPLAPVTDNYFLLAGVEVEQIIPEPATLLLFGSGLIGLVWRQRHRR